MRNSLIKNGFILIMLCAFTSCIDKEETLELPEEEFVIQDGDVEILFENQPEYGINIMIMGEGFTRDDVESGLYKQSLSSDIERFFGIYPMSDYKQHFNVYLIYAISEDEGVSVKGEEDKDTALSVTFDPENSPPQSRYIWARYKVRRYAKTGILERKFNHVSFVSMKNPDGLPLGGVALTGTAYEGQALYDSGRIGTMAHEFGHAFAYLADEYTVEDQDQFTEEDRKRYRERSVLRPNIDSLPVLDSIKWKKYFDIPGYEEVGVFEGASLLEEGMWRPEESSIMGNGGYFNAPSREAIVFRMATLARFHFDFEEYIGKDRIRKNQTNRSLLGISNFNCGGLYFESESP